MLDIKDSADWQLELHRDEIPPYTPNNLGVDCGEDDLFPEALGETDRVAAAIQEVAWPTRLSS